jgi:biotin-dependent carboxylase-like uncharacterized protein
VSRARAKQVTDGLRVDATGPQCTVQDLGRPGFAQLGVGRSGAADRGALIRANRLVGNADGAAALEITLGGFRLTARADCRVAITGAALPVSVDGASREFGTVLDLVAGQQLRLGRPTRGLRSYLSVLGGIDGPEVLGSRSTDTLSGLGPSPIAAGDELPIGVPMGGRVAGDIPPAAPEPDGTVELPAILGPRTEVFTEEAIAEFADVVWTVGVNANRVGLHLDGPPLARRDTGELPTEPMVAGAIQVPGSGRPVVFLADHPLTGGYPVIAVLTSAAVDLAAQLRPGRRLRFRPVPDPLTGLSR